MELIKSRAKSILERYKKVILILAGLFLIKLVLFNLYKSYETRMFFHYDDSGDSISTEGNSFTDWELEIALTSALIKEQNVIENLRTVRRHNRIKMFKENHKRIVETLKPKKFVYIGRSGAGYANKMYSLFTGFMVGLVTDSAIIINMTDVDRYIEEPFYKCFQTSSTTDGLINYLYKPNETFYFPYLTVNTYNFTKNFQQLYLAIPGNSTRYVFTGIGGTFFEMALNKTYWPTFQAYGLVSDETLMRADTLLRQTPLENTNYTVNTLWRVGFEFAHNILKTFWYPNANLQQHVDYYYNNYFKGHFVIGLQLREYYLTWEDELAICECAKEIEKHIKEPVKWFVSSDKEDRLNMVKKMFGDKVIHSNGTITHVSENPEGYFRALLDNELLSKCDELIISGGSTFGFLAAIRKGEYPLFLNGRRNATKCERFTFANPSFTYNNDTVA